MLANHNIRFGSSRDLRQDLWYLDHNKNDVPMFAPVWLRASRILRTNKLLPSSNRSHGWKIHHLLLMYLLCERDCLDGFQPAMLDSCIVYFPVETNNSTILCSLPTIAAPCNPPHNHQALPAEPQMLLNQARSKKIEKLNLKAESHTQKKKRFKSEKYCANTWKYRIFEGRILLGGGNMK